MSHLSFLPPKRVRSGSRVALVAPASPFKTDELAAGLDIVRAAGLEPVLGPNVRSLHSRNVHSAPVLDRAEELMWAFSDPSISAVITVLGGLGSGETLPYLDYNRIRISQRPLLGLSDITALNNGILAGADLMSINGQYPTIRVNEGEQIRQADSVSLELSLELMMSDQPWDERPFDFNPYIPRTVCPGQASGHVIGGNLDTLCTLLGSPFMPPMEDAVLFIEDTGKQSEQIARLLLHLRLAGVLDQVSGVVVGEFAEVPKLRDDHEPPIEDVIEEHLGHGPPCVMGFPFSHGPLTSPIPIGAMCHMDADAGTVSFEFKMV